MDPRVPSETIERWIAAGIITPEQGSAIRAFEVGPLEAPRASGTPSAGPMSRPAAAIAEVLAYVGAALALAGVILVVARAWPDLAVPVRLLISGGATVVFVGLGFAIPEHRDPVMRRLRAVLWLAASAASVVLGIVIARSMLETHRTATTIFVASLCATLVSGVLWRLQDRPLQQASTLSAFAIMAAAGSAIAWRGIIVGLVVWMIGSAYLALGVSRRAPGVVISETIGAVALLVGVVVASADVTPLGMLLGLGTTFALVLGSIIPGPLHHGTDQVIFGVSGLVIGLLAIPQAMTYFAFDAGVATGLTAWAVGAGLIALGASRRTRIPLVVEIAGGASVIIGAAVTGAESPGFATVFGLATAILLLVIGLAPGRIVLTVLGSLGLLVYVPWTIAWYFPGANRAPLLVTVAGILILIVAVILARAGHRLRRERLGDRSSGESR